MVDRTTAEPRPITDLDERVADLTFKARALAQAHPLTVTASAYRQQMVDRERQTQPLAEFSDWAATAFLVGYCVRRVEEADAEMIPDRLAERELSDLGVAAQQFSEDLRAGRHAGEQLLGHDLVEAMLDQVIGTEIDKRADHWKAQISESDWAQFEEYVAWWVIHGYAFRAAETAQSDA